MSRMIWCRKLKKESPGLETQPFPGAKGEEIFENISQEAWHGWQQHQTMLINEKHLNMMEKADRKFLNEQREKYLSGQEVEQAEGYIAPQED